MTQHHRKISAIVRNLLTWFSENARDLPWRQTRNPYAIWVSEIMLQQTQVKTVLSFWERWMRELPTIESVARARLQKIHKLWEGLGYYTRVRNLQKAARMILQKHNGQFPKRFEDILALPGIGRYTAGAISSIAFNHPAPILDGNVMRVLTRIFGIAESPRDKRTNQRLWQIAEELVRNSLSKTQHSRMACSHLNQSLMELGALVCTPRNPQCGTCPVKKLCVAFKEDRTAELPNLGKREKATARRFVAFVVERDGQFLVRRRPAGVVNAHLWEFPNVEILSDTREEKDERHANGHASLARAAREMGLDFHNAGPICTIKHSITRYRMTLDAFLIELKKTPRISDGVWLSHAKLDSLPLTSAHRKVLRNITTMCHTDLHVPSARAVTAGTP
ncbi:MAG TPA: A/G-specific adenine glycosylase [Verrucomicrobiae bacterium]|nr:A/G-specific adenine glycosylase [Verrucomicrobiae bacterium]